MEVSGSEVVANLAGVRARLAAVSDGEGPVLIAVSKTKPPELLQCAYDAGQREFGENYVAELCEKAKLMGADVRWHFIGHLQSNKVKLLLSVPNLACIHTLDSLKLAAEVNKHAALSRPDTPLEVMVQVNTSGEESKSGCLPAECAELCSQLVSTCPQLSLRGLMCIGKYSSSEGAADEDFACLSACRLQVAARMQCEPSVWPPALHGQHLAIKTVHPCLQTLALSMGMSHDFELAARAVDNAVNGVTE
ncbi:MAG: hypothetical protein SGPRY_004249 [Prymnesium sp.]